MFRSRCFGCAAVSLVLSSAVFMEDGRCAEPPSGEHAATEKSLTIPGEFSVGVPAEGYQWKLVREVEHQGKKIRWYGCTKEGERAVIVLVIEPRVAKTDAERTASLKGHYNGMLKAYTDSGIKIAKVRQPSLKTPIPERNSFGLAGENPATGEDVYVDGFVVFGRAIYAFQAVTVSTEQQQEFRAAIKSFKELSPRE